MRARHRAWSAGGPNTPSGGLRGSLSCSQGCVQVGDELPHVPRSPIGDHPGVDSMRSSRLFAPPVRNSRRSREAGIRPTGCALNSRMRDRTTRCESERWGEHRPCQDKDRCDGPLTHFCTGIPSRKELRRATRPHLSLAVKLGLTSVPVRRHTDGSQRLDSPAIPPVWFC